MNTFTIFKTVFNYLKKIVKLLPDTIITLINSLVLILVYFLFIGFTAIIARIMRKSFLNLHKQKTTSYWIQKEKTSTEIEEYYKQY